MMAETTQPPVTVRDILERAAEIDPVAWAAPLPSNFEARRLLAVRKAKAELESQEQANG